MKVLFVQLPTSHFGAREKVYPLGLSRLSSGAGKELDKRCLDMNLAADPWMDLGVLLQEFIPEIIALSFRNIDPLAGNQASYLPSLKTAAALARRCCPEARILAGGPAFSLFGEALMEACPELDIGLVGEGEKVFPLLLEEHILPARIPGIIWRENSRLHSNPSGQAVEMDRLPPLDLKAFAPGLYTGGNTYVAAIGIEGKRGCDLCCGYCLYPKLGGRKVRLRAPKLIVDEMELLVKEHGIGLFHFTDPVLNRPAGHFQQLCRELAERKLECRWTGFFREDLVSRENLAAAMEAGLCCVYFSGDALSEWGLKLLGKQLSRKDLLHGARITTDLRLLTVCHFLVNLPGDTTRDVAEAEEMLDRLLAIHAPAGNLGAVIFNHARLYPNAPLTKKLIATGELDPTLNLLYPVYYNPPEFSHVLHDFEARCHLAGVFSRLEIHR
jgi:putative variant cofactor biosynthesis B12-binding/radical SAM domain protein 1